jgi:hypothetical protein
MSTSAYAQRHKALGLCRNCPKPLTQGSSIFCVYHRDKDRIRRRIADKKVAVRLKEEFLKHYGNVCSCCGETIVQFLTLDHERGKGNDHRKELFKHNVGGTHMYKWLKRNNFPKGYTILCMNCNWSKRYSGICPHKLER